MNDALSLTVKESLKPGLIALLCTRTNKIQVLSSKNVAKLIARTMDQLHDNTYKTRIIQRSYNEGTLEWKFLEFVDVHPNVLDLILRYKTSSWSNQLVQLGTYAVISSYNALQLTIETKLVRHEAPQVALRTRRYRTFYVQKPFNSFKEASQYICNNNTLQVILDTNGISVPFKYKPLLTKMRKDDRLKGKPGRPKGSKTRNRKPKWIHPLLREKK